MFSLIRPVPIYIKLYTDKVEITRLEKELTISRSASDSFSNPRLVVANFYNAEHFVRTVIKDLVTTDSFIKPPLDVVIQQMEKLEGGLSDVERRALMDLGEHVGGRSVKIVEGANALSTAQALLELKNSKLTSHE